jgi:glycosyltransferase involved in cell wall biosynthesis
MSHSNAQNEFSHLKVAIVADWLTTQGGAEKVLESFLRVFPQAEFFSSVYIPENFEFLENNTVPVHTTWLQKLPKMFRKRHQVLFPFLPKAIETLNVSGFDLVISSSTFVAKGVITDSHTTNICYCHTPTRYFWDEWQYFLKEGLNIPKFLRAFKPFFPSIFSKMRIWDFVSAQRPDHYFGNSEYVVKRIQKYYRRDAHLLRPPVDYQRFESGLQEKKSDYYVAVGRIIPYKKFDLLVKTFKNLPHKKLKIAGRGPELEALQEEAKGFDNIEFLGFVSDEDLPKVVGGAKAYLFPQNEDAGITPMEALCTGTPCIAFKKGGALGMIHEETSGEKLEKKSGENKEIINGVFFEEQTPESLAKAIEKFETQEERFVANRKNIALNMQKFSAENFEKNFLATIKKFLKKG